MMLLEDSIELVFRSHMNFHSLSMNIHPF